MLCPWSKVHSDSTDTVHETSLNIQGLYIEHTDSFFATRKMITENKKSNKNLRKYLQTLDLLHMKQHRAKVFRHMVILNRIFFEINSEMNVFYVELGGN